MRRRAVVTGLGIVAPTGIGKDAFAQSLLEARSGIGPRTRLPSCVGACPVAAEVRGFSPAGYIDARDLRRMDLLDQYAVAAAKMSLEDAGLAITEENRDRVGLALGIALYGVSFGEEQHATFREHGLRKVSPFTAIAIFPCSPMGFISIALGCTGWSQVVSSCAASGADALGVARDAIEMGVADVMIAGGVEAPFSPSVLKGLEAAGALTRGGAGSPASSSCPFNRQRDGFVLGEGCGLLVIEGEDHALARGARIYAEVLGYGTACGDHDDNQLVVDYRASREAVDMALDDARCSNEMIDLLSANAASEPENDRGEADFIRRRYGEAPPPVTAIRSTVGQGLGASGGIQAVANVLSIDRGFIPPTLNYTDPDPACRVETLAVTLQRTPLRYVLQHTFGYLGIQSALVFGAYGTR